jgi:hypothetical protein
MAARGFMERVETHVAIEFGASVQPFTNITHNVRMAVIINAGYCTSDLKKSPSVTVINTLLSVGFISIFIQGYISRTAKA